MAGDLTIYGDRKSVWLLRDYNGVKEQVRMDLTDPAIFTSPYYYLQQNDIVYVSPNNTKKRTSLYSEQHDFKVSLFTLILTAITGTAAVIVSIIYPYSNPK